MTAAASAKRLPDPLVQTMSDLARAGFDLVPLGGGDDGKKPIRKLRDLVMSVGDCLGAMAAKGSRCYGVRLGGLVVLDLDQRDQGLMEHIEARFGPAQVVVASGRGWHLYYLAPEGDLPNLRGEGLPVDVKKGRNQYTAGPGSIRPDGVEYRPFRGDLATNPLTPLRLASAPRSRDTACPSASDGLVPEGKRHAAMVEAALEMAGTAQFLDDLAAKLRRFADTRCVNPATIPPAEVEGIAAWTWKCRLENNLWAGKNSVAQVNRTAIALLKGETAALGLYLLLVAEHGHTPGKRFALVWKAMRAAGLTDLGERAFLAARRVLEDKGLLRCVAEAVPGKAFALYQLSLPISEGSEGEGLLTYDRQIRLPGRAAQPRRRSRSS